MVRGAASLATAGYVPFVSGTAGSLAQDSGLAYDSATKMLMLTQSPATNSQRIAATRSNVVANTTGSVATFVYTTSDVISASQSANGIYGAYANNATTGCTAQSNCGTFAEPHSMGVLGKGEDTASGNITMYGVEGRVDGRGTASGHKYVGVIGASVFQGASLAAELRAHDALVQATTNGSTPLASGTLTAYYARAITGGATKWSFYGNDNGYMPKLRLGGTTTAPSYQIDIADATNPTMAVTDTTNGVMGFMQAQDSFALFGTGSNHPLIFGVNGSVMMTMLTSGSTVVGGTSDDGSGRKFQVVGQISQNGSAVPSISSGTAAPTSTPGKLGDMFVDSTNHKVYVADCASASSCWRILN